ncbi:hypothetical protein D3C72_309220 [compost metagenome]
MTIRITMNKVASYTNPSVLETDKKVTLVYGLNGCGKSTISNYLLDQVNSRYAECKTEGLNDSKVHVYNTHFVKSNFHEMDKLRGIFTLSKANKDVDDVLRAAKEKLTAENNRKESITNVITDINKNFDQAKARAEDITWEIKTKYSGGDRVLEYCLSGLKAKARLFDHLASLPFESGKTLRTTDKLRDEAEALQGGNAQKHDSLPRFPNLDHSLDQATVLGTSISGKHDSPIAGLIEKLGNTDWVNQGIPFMAALKAENDDSCPFCQSTTITQTLQKNIIDYFDGAFAEAVNSVKSIRNSHSEFFNSIPSLTSFMEHSFPFKRKDEFRALYGQLQSTLSSNFQLIERKIQSPSTVVTLADSSTLIAQLNDIIDSVNIEIKEHNTKIDNKTKALNDLGAEFWMICRKDYDQTVASYKVLQSEIEEKLKTHNFALFSANETIQNLLIEIANLQKQTVNVDAAIAAINTQLSGLGIDSFSIIKHEESTYRLSRNGVAAEDFHTLSEGEKTMISFLYFIELCKGKATADDTTDRKIVIVDDPISSLSHIYVFNVGQMIKHELFNSAQFEKVVVLTHSLYFFYELTDTNHERRKENQKLLRIVKNSAGSKVMDMKYEEIQNDYQSYWRVVTDPLQPPVLIANCMRNIVEYFFSFVKKHEFNNVFSNPKLKDQKHQAFYRFMNRESHSIGQNIFDIKEFDYDGFREAFKLLFVESGYPEHYEAMTKAVA